MPDELPLNLTVDRTRLRLSPGDGTGIFFRAKLDGKLGCYDLSELDMESVIRLLVYYRNTTFAENVIGIMLGHGHFWEGGPVAVRKIG